MSEYDETEEDLEVELEEGDEEPDEKVPAYDDDSLNLVFDFVKSKQGKEYLKKISTKVDADYQADWDASDEYRSNRKADWKLFAGDLPKKTGPIKDASNPHLPMMLENLSRLCYRATGELFGDWQTILSAVPVGADDEDVASFVTRHMNWQFNEQIPDFKRQIGHRGVLTFFAMGDVVVHSYYDQETRLNRHEVLTCDNFVTPYMHVTTMPDFSDCPHYTKILRFYRHQIEAREGEWYDVDKVLSKNHPSWDDEPDSPLAEAVAETQGISPESSDSSKELGGETTPYTLLWYEGWLRLPNQEKDRWCQVIQDKHTKCILSLMIHERLNWQDKERYDAQVREKNSFGQMMDMYQQQVQTHQMVEARAQEGVNEVSDAIRANAADTNLLLAQVGKIDGMVPPPPQPPPPPNWMLEKLQDPDPETGMPRDPMSIEPEPPRREPVHLFTHGVCIEPLHGNLGLSYGSIQADLNRAANVALAQFTDQATLKNSPGLITNGLEFEDDFVIGPGQVNKAKGAISGSLKDHIMVLDPGAANPQLKEVVELMLQTGQNSIQSPNVLSGEAGKSGETAKGLLGRIEQATKQLSVVTGKYADVVVQVGKNNAYLNSVFLPEDEVVRLLNTESQQYEELRIGRALYERGYRFQMRADLRFATQAQKIEEADAVTKMALEIPPLAMNAAFVYTCIKNSLIARGRYDLVQLLGKPPPPMMNFPVPAPPGPPPGAPPPQAGPPQGPPPGQPAQNAPPPNGPPS